MLVVDVVCGGVGVVAGVVERGARVVVVAERGARVVVVVADCGAGDSSGAVPLPGVVVATTSLLDSSARSATGLSSPSVSLLT